MEQNNITLGVYSFQSLQLAHYNAMTIDDGTYRPFHIMCVVHLTRTTRQKPMNIISSAKCLQYVKHSSPSIQNTIHTKDVHILNTFNVSIFMQKADSNTIQRGDKQKSTKILSKYQRLWSSQNSISKQHRIFFYFISCLQCHLPLFSPRKKQIVAATTNEFSNCQAAPSMAYKIIKLLRLCF